MAEPLRCWNCGESLDDVPLPISRHASSIISLMGLTLSRCLIQSYPIQGYPIQGYPIQGYPIQGYPIQGYPVQGYPIQGYPTQNCPTQKMATLMRMTRLTNSTACSTTRSCVFFLARVHPETPHVGISSLVSA